MKQARVIISGFVQGIGFRHFVKKEAEKLGLTGWVRNISDNKVEALLQGSASNAKSDLAGTFDSPAADAKDKIEEMILLCRKGPLLAEVENVQVRWEEEKERLETFEIII